LTHFPFKKVRVLEIGRDVNDVEIGRRLRYAIKRESAPYATKDREAMGKSA